MCLFRRIALVFIIIFVPLLIITSITHSEEKKEGWAVFQGQVINISNKFITVEKTSIVLPKKAKTLDISGVPISFEKIKKGDYVIVTIEKNEATIQITGKPRESKNQKSIPE